VLGFYALMTIARLSPTFAQYIRLPNVRTETHVDPEKRTSVPEFDTSLFVSLKAFVKTELTTS